MSFFKRPVLNSTDHVPTQHWHLDGDGLPTEKILVTRCAPELLTVLPESSAKSEITQSAMLFDNELSSETTDMSPFKNIDELRLELAAWRAQTDPAQWSISPVTLVVEIKGIPGHDVPLKIAVMRDKWVPAVNRLGTFGRSGFSELRALHDFRPDLYAATASLLPTEMPVCK